jgi:hypothetical protein
MRDVVAVFSLAGQDIVSLARAESLPVITIPGPSAVVAALSISGKFHARKSYFFYQSLLFFLSIVEIACFSFIRFFLNYRSFWYEVCVRWISAENSL